MDKPPSEDSSQLEECTTRIVWAAQILAHLTKQRSHTKDHLPTHAIEEDEVLDHAELDARTENQTVLRGSRESILSKYLDCVSQLLSLCKGWDGVTATALREREDGVEVDVARNDCFGRKDDGGTGISEYCKKLRDYLGTEIRDEHISEFELAAIRYTRGRVDYWLGQIHIVLSSTHARRRVAEDRPESHHAPVVWEKFICLLTPSSVREGDFRNCVVSQAYQCVLSAEVRNLLRTTYGNRIGEKLWNCLKFLARPISDCRLLHTISRLQPHLQNVKISAVPPEPKTSIKSIYQISVLEAWARLSSKQPTESQAKQLMQFKDDFSHDCVKPYGLHAEMQLFMHYERKPTLTPNFRYFGCSKTTCLLCDEFLQALKTPIATRGTHGICYRAWGVPQFFSGQAINAMKQLEKSLVSRIEIYLNASNQGRKAHFAAQPPQSGLVSLLSESTLEDTSRNRRIFEAAREAEIARRERQYLLDGIGLGPAPTDSGFHPDDACIICNKSPSRLCSQCRSCYYCSSQCQKADWSSHSLLCKKFSVQEAQPSPFHKRAILFPVDRKKPRLIWVPYEVQHPSEEDRLVEPAYHSLDLYPYLGADRPFKGTMRIEHNPLRDRNLGSGFAAWAPRKEGYSIALFFRDTYLKDGSATNQSIMASVSISSGVTPHQWCGPIVALREVPFERHEDIHLGDFRHIIDYLRAYRTTELRESPVDIGARRSAALRGVKICCFGERELHGSEPFVLVDVPKGHPTRLRLFNEGQVSPISELLGMPVKLWKIRDNEILFDPAGWPKGKYTDSNPEAIFLMTETNPEKPGWGWGPMSLDNEMNFVLDRIGNVLAIRVDGQDLAVEDVQMMCHFAQRRLGPLFEASLETNCLSPTKQEVLNVITWENMAEFWEERREESSDLDD